LQIPQVFYLFGTQFQVYTVVISAAVVLIMLMIIIRAPRGERRAAFDMCLLALVLALLLARVEHVALRWDYYAEHLDQALDIRRGGLGWHGALLGAWVGMHCPHPKSLSRTASTPGRGTSRRVFWLPSPSGTPRSGEGVGVRASHHISYSLLALALIILTAAAWIGCAGAGCAYGAEVRTLADYPPGVTAELRDVYGIAAPRWNTPLYGLLLAGGMAAVAGAGYVGISGKPSTPGPFRSLTRERRGWGEGVRTANDAPRTFFVVLAILAFGMFVIGYARADAVVMLGGVRGDQVLDAATLIVALSRIVVGMRDVV
jgi:prolipoprotein diacylglyceryltransferase